MPLPYSIILLFLLLSALGLGYMTFVGDESGWDHPAEEAVLDDTTSEQTQDRAEVGRSTNLTASADRRMDDFGPGPSGKVVTMPLRDRHRQAFSGRTDGVGGGTQRSPNKDSQGVQTVETAAADRAPSESASEEPAASSVSDPALAAVPESPAPTELETLTDDTVQQAALEQQEEAAEDRGGVPSRFRVIEREVEASSETAAPAEAPSVTPSFDIVRVDPLGNAVLAGRAAPFADVDIKVGEKVIDSVKATNLGEWVSTPLTPLESGDQEISLAASGENKPVVPSKQVVVVSIPEPTGQQVRETGEAVAVLLDREKGGEGKVLQAPGRLQGEGQLALKLVDYDADGAIKLSGEAPPGVPVRIYVDNEPAALVIGDAKGSWITTLDNDLPGGDYTLRLDQLDKKGETVARLETPLTRVTTPPVEGDAKVDYVVVQPGNSLWRIARRLSGDGFNYVYIYEANQAQIRDPDVIYPGQVFEVPAETGIAG